MHSNASSTFASIARVGRRSRGLLAIASARMLGAQRVIAIDRFPERLAMARVRAGATDVLDYEERRRVRGARGARGPPPFHPPC